jgi:hypothetical protein
MRIVTRTRVARSLASLDRLLARVGAGEEERPDWIALQGAASLDRLPVGAMAPWLERLHAATLRGFRHPPFRQRGRAYLARWRACAQRGFHDFIEGAWSKGYASATVEDHDYLATYLDGGLAALDPYGTYSAVLGTWEYGVEDFVETRLLAGLGTIVEPMAGTADFSHAGHFRYPGLVYLMLDRDEVARRHVLARRWTPGTRHEFLLGDVLDEASWRAVRAATVGPSLAYIGKQSQNFFGTRDLLQLLRLGTTYADHLLLELTPPYLVEREPGVDDLTRPEQRAAGLRVALEDRRDRTSNPLTNRLHFDLVAQDATGRRVLFEYHDWIGWQAPSLVALGEVLGLVPRYLHAGRAEFLPVEEGTDDSDAWEENTFLLFSRA